MKEYVVLYEQGEDGGWGAYLPDLPVFALGDTRQEAGELMEEALGAYLEELQRMGEPLPPPAHIAETTQLRELTT